MRLQLTPIFDCTPRRGECRKNEIISRPVIKAGLFLPSADFFSLLSRRKKCTKRREGEKKIITQGRFN